VRAVVLGIGNTLLTDEALGVKAVEQFEAAYRVPEDVLLIDGGTSAMDLMDRVAGCELLVVADAVLSGQAPGSLVRLAGGQVPVFFRAKLSPHQVGLSDLLASLEFAGELPARTVVLGLEPFSMRLGLEMTPPVRRQLPALVEMIAGELRAAGIDVAPRAAAG
jgi:hydrogenase maturation protease